MTSQDTQRNVANPNRVRNLTHDDFREADVPTEDGGSDQAA